MYPHRDNITVVDQPRQMSSACVRIHAAASTRVHEARATRQLLEGLRTEGHATAHPTVVAREAFAFAQTVAVYDERAAGRAGVAAAAVASGVVGALFRAASCSATSSATTCSASATAATTAAAVVVGVFCEAPGAAQSPVA